MIARRTASDCGAKCEADRPAAVLSRDSVAASPGDVAGRLQLARQAQLQWAQLPLRRRLKVIRNLRSLLAERASDFAQCVSVPGRMPAQTLAAELGPLCDACAFLEREAGRWLAPRTLGMRGRPLLLWGVRSQVIREPLGVVLILGPFNYPLMLPGIQALQAIAAGNAVVIKPGRGGSPAAALLAQVMHEAGFTPGLVQVLDESVDSGTQAIAAGVDKVFLTGSGDTGRAVLAACASTLTPVVCELSGDDPAIVLQDADAELAARCIGYGMTLNGGHTCIAPRRLIVHVAQAAALAQALKLHAPVAEALPVTLVESATQAIAAANDSDHALGASVFGSAASSEEVASGLSAGVVTINDVIVPTADPRLPFGGRKLSGFGLTRGPEGLLEMTCVKVIAARSGRWQPHLDAEHPTDAALLTHLLSALHAQCGLKRFQAFLRTLRVAISRRSA